MRSARIIKIMLDEIKNRYDFSIADRVWAFTQAEVEESLIGEDVDESMWIGYQAIAINKMMKYEGFSDSEIAQIQLHALETVKNRRVDNQIREFVSYDGFHRMPIEMQKRLEAELGLDG